MCRGKIFDERDKVEDFYKCYLIKESPQTFIYFVDILDLKCFISFL